jgi:transcription elongation factor Elf1
MKKKRRKRGTRSAEAEASYVCDACGEEIVVPIDLSAGNEQEYVEDCPVCCRPNVIHVEVDESGDVRVWAEGE